MLLRMAWAIYFIFVGVTCATAAENTEANKIFVETVQLLDQAAAAKPSEALGLYEKALQNLDRIVTKYPGSDLAVKIISGQAIGQVSRAGIEKALVEARKAECLRKLSASCIVAEALTTAHSIKDADTRVRALSSIAAAQAQAGMTREANETLADALTTARSIEDVGLRVEALATLAKPLVKMGLKK